MEAYRSGHNEAVLKTVWVKAHGGSNPSSSATKNPTNFVGFFCCYGRVILVQSMIARGYAAEPPTTGLTLRLCE